MVRVENPRLVETWLVEKTGLTEIDLKPIRLLQKLGFNMFLHGTGITGDLADSSDVDFAAIGPLGNLNDFLIQTSALALNAASLNGLAVDYFSLKFAGARPVSIHIQSPDFRIDYPKHPYAIEVRSEAKTNGSKYWMSGLTGEGRYLLYQTICPSERVNGFVTNLTPQAGVWRFISNQITPVNEPNVKFGLGEKAYQVDIRTGETNLVEVGELSGCSVWQPGLETAKMLSDTPLGETDEQISDDLVVKPLLRIMEAMYSHTQHDPIKTLPLMLKTEALVRTNGEDRAARVSQGFLVQLENRLGEMVRR